MIRRNSDERLRVLERRYVASPDDHAALRAFLRELARSRGNTGMLKAIRSLWATNDLSPESADLDVLAETVFGASSHSEDLFEAMETVERIALVAEEDALDDLDPGVDEIDEDQRSYWWRRERFHDLDFDRKQPWKGGRLYSPQRGTFLIVTEVDRSNGRHGYLALEILTEHLAEGLDAVLVEMAKGGRRRPLSAWALRRILAYVAKASPGPRVGSALPFAQASFVTFPTDDPTDVVEEIAGAPAAPVGPGTPRSYPSDANGPSTTSWRGCERTDRVEVVRASGNDLKRLLAGTLSANWQVAEHPYHVLLSELRTRYVHRPDGAEKLDLIWVGPHKDPQETSGAIVMSWNNEQTDPDLAEFEWGDTIVDQFELDEAPLDWLETAARFAHNMEVIVVDDWEPRRGPRRRPQFDSRREAADDAFENFDFGTVVAETSGWEQAGDVWTRSVYMEPELSDIPSDIAVEDAPTTRLRFTVRFGPETTEIVETDVT